MQSRRALLNMARFSLHDWGLSNELSEETINALRENGFTSKRAICTLNSKKVERLFSSLQPAQRLLLQEAVQELKDTPTIPHNAEATTTGNLQQKLDSGDSLSIADIMSIMGEALKASEKPTTATPKSSYENTEDKQLDGFAEQLDREVALLIEQRWAPATKRTNASHERSFVSFCERIGVPSVPASNNTIARYVAFLARDKSFKTVQQYVNIIRILHLDKEYPNPLNSNWTITSLLKGVKRSKGDTTASKLPLLPAHLLKIHSTLNFSQPQDCRFWAALLTGFFGLLRVSNLTCTGQEDCKSIRRCDVRFHKSGTVIEN
ncbi:uncharacterized protein LOC106154462 [Lingula anatina]|uniref:Uncharacterized protein LOC106154462 n=1 Tax=Lingula anatina TaxID=7574 RepID=A0A1S3HDY9_LINAN|nr:uncharacterized protein LOC106154462 [Lingula anatina]|eukprot:XP_013384268.1 uncharacterized protein LOC106154462 [Lingula anatina]